jgi:hypothetical protein
MPSFVDSSKPKKTKSAKVKKEVKEEKTESVEEQIEQEVKKVEKEKVTPKPKKVPSKKVEKVTPELKPAKEPEISATSEEESVTMQESKNMEDTQVLKPMDDTGPKIPKPKKGKKIITFFVALVVILFGVGTGYAVSVMTGNGGNSVNANLGTEKGLEREVASDEIVVGTKIGVADEGTFRDSAEGTLAKGGFEGEGSHTLLREGGESQTVYMTSSVIDLDQFIDRKVKVWGETIGAQKVAWLMDVGKLEVLE